MDVGAENDLWNQCAFQYTFSNEPNKKYMLNCRVNSLNFCDILILDRHIGVFLSSRSPLVWSKTSQPTRKPKIDSHFIIIIIISHFVCENFSPFNFPSVGIRQYCHCIVDPHTLTYFDTLPYNICKRYAWRAVMWWWVAKIEDSSICCIGTTSSVCS